MLVVLLALGWAVFTQHVWEDYYITYRASKNLATGHGLTFTAGERVHSFTSPLGVLLPALASLLAGNASDDAALWIFRFMAAAALAGAVVITARTAARVTPAGGFAALLPVLLVVTDAKTVDYTINGMETPFLLLFLAWTWWALVTSPPRAWRHLGLAWAGLMWTRPDAFVYIGTLAVGAQLFRPSESGPWWRRLLPPGDFVRAGALTTVLYLPWLVWAWRYYGTPVPNTITAKGLFLPPFTPAVLLDWVMAFPRKLWTDPSILAGTFMPAYSYNTGWPMWASRGAAGLALVAALLWLVPRLRWEARVASFAALAGQFYLYSCVGFPTPWYLPPVAFLSLVALGLALGQLAGAARPVLRGGARAAGIALVSAAALLAVAVAWQLRCQQRLIEDGQRRGIGQWLKAQAASPRDTVFLEPLGYIGFFSNLKMLDYPGLCAPEVIAARRRAESHSYPFCWSELIMLLQPDWLVLRPYEREYIENRDREVLEYYYERAKVFDVRPQVAAVPFLPGRGYLVNDACFEVWRRRPGLPGGIEVRRIKVAQLTRRDAYQPVTDSGLRLLAHAPAVLAFPVGPGVRSLAGAFGILPEAYKDPAAGTDGANFLIAHISPTGARTPLFERGIYPGHNPGDRGDLDFRVDLPADSAGAIELTITAGPNGSNAFDWTYWSTLRLEIPPRPARQPQAPTGRGSD